MNSTPPPPLICQSTKPGLRIPPPRSTCSPPRGRSSKRVSAWIEAALDNERAIVVQPFAVEDARPVENLHCAASRLRRDGAANEQDRPIGWIVQRRREPRGDIGLEIGTQGFAHAPDQRDPLRAKRDHAARQARRWRAPRLRTISQRDRIMAAPRVQTRAARRRRNLPASPRAPNSSSPPDRRRIRPRCRQSARSPAQGRHRRASQNASHRGRYASPIRRRRARIRARQ